MTFQVGGSIGARLRVTGPNGQVRLDSDERPFLITDYVQGKVSFAQRNPASGTINTVTDKLLGTCRSGSNWIMGALRTQFRDGWSYQSGIMTAYQDRWFNCNGTVVLIFNTSNFLSLAVKISGSQVFLRERMIITRTGPTQLPFEIYSVFFRLNIGRFHG